MNKLKTGFVGLWVVGLAVNALFYGMVAYIVMHFVMKAW